MSFGKEIKIRDYVLDILKNLNNIEWIVVENYGTSMFLEQQEQENLFGEVETETPRFRSYKKAYVYAKRRQEKLGQNYSFSICPLTPFIKFK